MELFKKEKLTEFFDTEKVVDADIELIEYQVQLKEGLTFLLHISPHEQYAILELQHANIETPLLEIGLHDLAHIDCDDENLYFYENGQDVDSEEPLVTIRVKPAPAFSMSIGRKPELQDLIDEQD